MDGGDIAAGGGGGGGGTSIHVTALDGIVNVNSLFTLAAFVGLAWRPSADGPGLAAGADRAGSPCAAGDRAESDLVSFHVLAFACFLFSSLVALCLKQLVRTFPPHRRRGAAAGPSSSSSALGRTARINRAALRVGILASAVGSVAGCGFLMMALVNVVQVKLDRAGSPCAAGDRAESDLVSFHVLAFACFLFSSLVALCLKQLVRTFPTHHRRGTASASSSSVLGRTARINRAALRVGILTSAVGSVAGCGFLMMALVNVVQVKLGRLGCGAGGSAALAAVVPLVTLVPAAMLIYIGIVFYAFTR